MSIFHPVFVALCDCALRRPKKTQIFFAAGARGRPDPRSSSINTLPQGNLSPTNTYAGVGAPGAMDARVCAHPQPCEHVEMS